MNLDNIAKLLTQAETEKASAKLLASLKSASVDIKDEIHARTLERNRFWKTATDIRVDTETRAAAKDGHADLEMVLATLESATTEMAKATDRVQTGIGAVARAESLEVLNAKRKAIADRIAAEWDTHVNALAAMLGELAEVEKATKTHNYAHKDNIRTVEADIRPQRFGGNISYASQEARPMRYVELQRIDPAQPLRGL